MVHLPPDAPAPRLCLVEKSRPDQEYGYNLHAERGRGQFVGTVDRGSAADRAGLRTGDRIFAVNGADIQQETHKKVVERIKENPLRCELLVLAESEAQWYAQRNIPVNTSLPNIIRVPNEGGARSRTASKTNGGSSPPSNWYSPSQKEGKQPVFVAPPPPVDDPAMSDSKPRPRLCYLEKQSPDDEFGFNLHAEKGKGHFIGTVDRGGIGHKAGLEMGQRIVGVHETLVFPNTPHKEVVALIKRFPLTTTLLVASEEVDKWYTEHSAAYSFDYVQVANQPHVYTIDDENATVTPSPREEEHPKEADEHSLHSAKTEEEHGEVLHEESHEDHEEELHRAQNFIVHHEVEEEHIPEHHEEEVHHEEHHDDALLDQVFAAFTPSTTIAHAPPPAPVEEPHEEPERAPSRGSSAPSASRSSLSSPSPQPSSNHREPAVRAVNGSAPKEDIFALSAQEARERLKLGRRSNRAPDMPIEEKYRLVSNM